jgi:hypothetical protein
MDKFHASLGKQREKLGGHLYNFIKHGKKAGRAFALPGPNVCYGPVPVLHSGWFTDLGVAYFSKYWWIPKVDHLLTQFTQNFDNLDIFEVKYLENHWR